MYRNDDPPDHYEEEPLDNCAECNKKLEGEDQQWFCSKGCETKHVGRLKAEDDAHARAMLEDMELTKSFFHGRV